MMNLNNNKKKFSIDIILVSSNDEDTASARSVLLGVFA